MEKVGPGNQPNAQMFVNHKYETKAAMITNMVAFNHTCSYEVCCFKLP